MAGPLLWPADEPWPVCKAVHPKGTGHLLSDVRQLRRIQENAREREYTDEEQRLIEGMTEGNHVPELQERAPLPMLAVAQLYAREIPDLVGPEDHDLLQVFWCPFEVHGADRTIDVVLKWRRSTGVGAVLTPQPEPPVVGRKECVPNMCVVHPERVVEHEYLGLLEEELQEEIDEWEEGLLDEEEEDEVEPPSSASYATYEEYAEAMAVAQAAEPEEINYMSDLSIAPGWKVGGFASWHLTDPAPVDCGVCGAAMPPLLTVATWECDGASRSWLPIEDRDAGGDPHATNPTDVYLGRGLMRVHTCPTDPAHPHRLSFQ
ncbi:hypothetical protein ABZS61_11860 [Streptomyces sp. NPDC005566]|uniref:hypothetical protein n=1 Tax=Streptomyces sp. NPDC005566 TaxID=3156886 RepID=UPI0033AB5A82